MNANITKIEITQSIHTMGKITEDLAAEWIEFLKSKLAEKFPYAEISVKLSNRSDSNNLYAESRDDGDGCPIDTDPKNTVQEFISSCWDWWL